MREHPPKPKKGRPAGHKPIEEKESFRWIEGLRRAESTVAPDTQLVHVADREADIFELFARPRAPHSELLIRVKNNRQVKHELGQLFPTLAQSPLLGELTVTIRRTPQRLARTARVAIRAIAVTLEVPDYLARQKPELVPIELNALRSKKPPTLHQAINWLARLGGFLNRKGDEPGIKTLWRGYTKLQHLLEGAQLAKKP